MREDSVRKVPRYLPGGAPSLSATIRRRPQRSLYVFAHIKGGIDSREEMIRNFLALLRCATGKTRLVVGNSADEVGRPMVLH